MTMKKYYVGLSPSQERVLANLAAKLGLDKSNTLRYCLARIAEQEQVSAERSRKSGSAHLKGNHGG